jgi:hypothetical protein
MHVLFAELSIGASQLLTFWSAIVMYTKCNWTGALKPTYWIDAGQSQQLRAIAQEYIVWSSHIRFKEESRAAAPAYGVFGKGPYTNMGKLLLTA